MGAGHVEKIPEKHHPRRGVMTFAAVAVGIVATIGIGAYKARDTSAQPHMTLPLESTGGHLENITSADMHYFPGSKVEANQLRIAHTNRRIVEQDGTGGQPNPPIDIYGPHFEVSGDFVISASVSERSGDASVQFYGSPPVVQDEFRVESPSVRLTVEDSRLSLKLWDGRVRSRLDRQEPVIRRTYSIHKTQNTKITVTRHDGKLDIDANGKHLGVVADKGIFDAGTVFLGAEAESEKGSFLLSDITGQSLKDGSLKVTALATQPPVPLDPNGFQATIAKKRPDFYFGSAMALGPMADKTYRDKLGYFGGMSLENALKWQFVWPHPDVKTYQEADALIDIAEKQHMRVHAHAIFGEALPLWMQNLPVKTEADKARVAGVMTELLTDMVTRYKGRVHSWDLNEVVADYDDFDREENKIYRENKFYQAMGKDYLVHAVKIIRSIDPGAKIMLNEFGVEYADDRSDALHMIMGDLASQGARVDGIGFQAHVFSADDFINPHELADQLQWLADNNYVGRISEMDVTTEKGIEAQANQYADIFKVCWQAPSCTSFTTWGFYDKYNMWQADNRTLERGQDYLWNAAGQPTPAIKKILHIIQNTEHG